MDLFLLFLLRLFRIKEDLILLSYYLFVNILLVKKKIINNNFLSIKLYLIYN